MADDARLAELRGLLAEALITGAGLDRELADELADALLPVVREAIGDALWAAAREQRHEATQLPDVGKGSHSDGHRCAADFLKRRTADALRGHQEQA